MNTVSVIIPAHNSATTLVEALDSVVHQTRPVQEIIVVDDVSSDDTIRVFENWQRSLTGTVEARLLRQSRNTGPAGARNTGIRAATGDWIAFLDADDASLPGRIAAQLNTAAICRAALRWYHTARLGVPAAAHSLRLPGHTLVAR